MGFRLFQEEIVDEGLRAISVRIVQGITSTTLALHVLDSVQW
jgi:hypothetical protein